MPSFNLNQGPPVSFGIVSLPKKMPNFNLSRGARFWFCFLWNRFSAQIMTNFKLCDIDQAPAYISSKRVFLLRTQIVFQFPQKFLTLGTQSTLWWEEVTINKNKMKEEERKRKKRLQVERRKDTGGISAHSGGWARVSVAKIAVW